MNKKVFITGGSRGIGFAIAKKFLEGGYETAISARSEANLAAAAKKLRGVKTFAADISQKEATKTLAKTVQKEFGTLDVLVNNAGTFMPGEIHKEEDEVFEQMIATNLSSAYYLTKGLIGSMIEQGRGTIINMCSVAAIGAYANGGSYGISKHALLGFSRNLREEVKAYGLQVVTIHPGAVYTDSWKPSGLPEERFIPVEDIAEICWVAANSSPRSVMEEIIVRPLEGDI